MHTQLDEIYRQIEAEGVESVDPELVEADAEQTNA